MWRQTWGHDVKQQEVTSNNRMWRQTTGRWGGGLESHDLTQVRLESKLWGLETYLTNSDERLDLTLTWHSWCETLHRWLASLGFSSFFFFGTYWDVSLVFDTLPSATVWRGACKPGRWRACQSGTVADRIRGGEAAWRKLRKSSNLDSKIISRLDDFGCHLG